ncbi:MAG: hypothetical protein KKF06_01215 [Candidatus Margulisbacteria bacterium]|nr:hypothetical protein [Candidatus Margulisiibacteriota bacterium]
MRRCSVCRALLTPCNEGLDHIGFEPYTLNRVVFICQGCLNSIQNQIEYGISYQYAEV